MSKQRFYYGIFDDGTEHIEDDWKKKHYFNLDDVAELLNEQQDTIQELERKLKKYANIGEEQLRQIIDLQDELNECRARKL